MPAFVKPESFEAGKELTINGTDYEPGDPIAWEDLKTVRNISSLVGNRWIIPIPSDPHYRRTLPSTPAPTDMPASVLKETIL